jgi:hypothetical protein
VSGEEIRWLAGRPEIRCAVERWRAGALAGELLRDSPRRRLVRLPAAEAGDLLIKHFRLGSGRHRRREAWKTRLGRSPADREHRTLAALHARGVAVPAPLGLAALPGGDRLLVLPFMPGASLAEALHRPHPERRRTLAALGALLAQLHDAGFAHGDLHAENVLVTGEGPVLVDLQHARRLRGRWDRTRELGELDYGLWRRASLADRVRLRAAALGLARPFDAAAREALRRVGEAAEARAFAHGRSRTRRALRPGRLVAELRLAQGTGLRARDFSPQEAALALAAHAEAIGAGGAGVLKDDVRSRVTDVRAGGRRVIVKQVLARGPARVLADALRGSPARRAWRGGHGLLARGIGAARPLASLERRRAGLPVASWLVLEHLAPAIDALEAASAAPAPTVEALLGLVDRLHRRGVEHGDLKATHVFLDPAAAPPRAWLVDMEAVRFRRRLSVGQRLAALSELNASLPDPVPAALRREAFARYAAIHRFPAGTAAAARAVVRQSLARGHRWTGAGCACAAGPAGHRPSAARSRVP